MTAIFDSKKCSSIDSVEQAKYLHGPIIDGLLLGGASVMVFVFLRLMRFEVKNITTLAFCMVIAANFVNHPHFAHSYQLFYGTWRQFKKGALPVGLAMRWWFAGFAAPILLFIMLTLGAYRWFVGEGLVLAILINIMGGLVGWHYVKQGFGMAMIDAALKGKYWSVRARRALLWNAYACWITAWLIFNWSGVGSGFWGFFGLRFHVPGYFVIPACLAAACTSIWSALEIYRCFRANLIKGAGVTQLPLNGVLAYVVTLYFWVVFANIEPAFIFVIPFFHSLQYLAVVWRYKINEINEVGKQGVGKAAGFFLTGVVLGFLGFWLVPGYLNLMILGEFPKLVGYTSVALASTWVFINVHHYLIDNVLWRQGNPNVLRYLFHK